MTEFSKEIWEQNYKAPGERTVKDTWKRLATHCAQPENIDKRDQVEKDFYSILEDFKFIPGGRIMANLGVAGRESTTLMNCFVHHPKDLFVKDPDSITGIYDALARQAHTLKSEGGYGTNFSWIRPKGTYVKGIGSRTPGVLKFMELWDKSSEIITMGSDIVVDDVRPDEKKKIRKGAQMAVLSIWHPEIEDFIVAKQTANRLVKFNMSVGITDGFMQAVIADKNWKLIFPNTEYEKYEDEWNGDIEEWIAKGYPVKTYKTVKARELWDKITYATYTRNEPGVLFLDLFNKLNPLNYAEKIYATNPCGEIGMATGVCNLGSLNLVKFVIVDKVNHKITFDFEAYKKAIRIAVRYMDNINDISRAPLPEYKDSMIMKRRIGLGNMGLGSLHLMLGIPYGSDESLDLIKQIYKVKTETELLASCELGEEKGSFPLFDAVKYFDSYWWTHLDIDPSVKQYIEQKGCMRNSHHAMNAPTGNSGIYAEIVSGGIEPSFLLSYKRWSSVTEHEQRKLREQGLKYPNALVGEWFETEHFKFATVGDEQVLQGTFNGDEYTIDKNRGLVKSTIVEDYGWRFVQDFYSPDEVSAMLSSGKLKTTSSLTVDEHLRPLKVIAHFTNMNNSKTVNIPESYPFEDFKDLYLDAWRSNIKGVTTYRAGTMTAVLEKIESHQNELEKLFAKAGSGVIKDVNKLPDKAYSEMYILKDNNKKKWYVTVTFVSEKLKRPFAIFVHTNNKEGNEVTNDFIEAMEKLLIEKGIDRDKVLEQKAKYVGQSNTTKIARIIGMALRHNLAMTDIIDVLENFDIQISSFMFHLKKLLCKFVKEGTKTDKMCPSCGKEKIVYTDGCKMCPGCGWTAC